ncbi:MULTISPECIES: SDR family NAD(P)-dependent oxidoreductase [unclassified Pseudomonas]|uniref:SDR family NAD(P)-dependent oxidoreductase n=1 Tax=unclassified Pseudomonas TaxID=196821 RepID=UPI0008DEF3FE|nr:MULTISPECIES: SDR family NAD(P)-dependent oxidoreductase [unclassified Pseudomonas]SFI97221.1 short chain dehydrogenase [Pseudomonas sp. NFPP04]SFK08290.1 short chain dehydrogenase [Pseudomonas sp. NFPP11]
MTVERDFTNKVVLVTGGTKGIGYGIAECFLKAGATVVVCGRNAPQTLPGAEGRSAEFFPADVREGTDLDRLFSHIQGKRTVNTPTDLPN